MNNNLLRCPECHKRAADAWELFVLFSPYMIMRKCRHCGQPVKINKKTLKYIALSLLAGFIIGNALKKFFSIDNHFFDVFILALFSFLPFFTDCTLFIKRETMTKNKANARPFAIILLLFFVTINSAFDLITNILIYYNRGLCWAIVIIATNVIILFSILGLYRMKKWLAIQFPIFYGLLYLEHFLGGAILTNIYLEFIIPAIYTIIVLLYWKRLS